MNRLCRFVLPGVLSFLSSILACLLWGFKFGIFNNEFHIVIVYKIAKGINFPGDAMAASMGNFPSPFWHLVAQCSKAVPTATVFLAFYIAGWVLLNVGVSSMIAAFTEKKGGVIPWVFGSLAVLAHGFTMDLPLGADPVIMPYLSHTFVSVGLCLLSLSLSVEKRYGWSAAVLGIAYNINAMQANFILGILLILWIAAARAEGRKGLSRFVQCVTIFAILASPTILWIFSVLLGPTSDRLLTGQALYDYAKYYFPFHYFWSVKTLSQKLNGVALSFLPLLLAVSNRFLGGNRFHFACEKELRIASVVMFGYVAAGIFFSFCLPSRLILNLHFFRSDALLFPIAVSLLAAILINRCENDRYLLPIHAAALVASLCHDFAASLALISSAAGVKYMKERYPDQCRPAASSFPYSILSGIFLLTLIVYLGISFVDFKKHHDIRWKSINDSNAEIEQVARSVSEIAPRNALFVVPPVCYLRSHLQRGVYISMHDGGVYMWKKGFELEYIRRLRVLGIRYTPGFWWNRSTVTKEFEENIHSALLRTKAEGVTHAILPSSTVRNIPKSPILRSENFFVLDIDTAILATSPSPL